MNLNLKNKNALVCASSAGIGKAIAKGLATEGANITILGRDSKKLNTALEEIKSVATGKVLALQCDLGKSSDIEKAYKEATEKMGQIDILINNQGGPTPGKFDDISLEQTRQALEVNLFANLMMTKLCLPHMKKNNWGRIINILSVSAKEPIPGLYLSNLIRPAILGFAKSVATDYAAFGVTVNNLLPSAVLSDRTSFFINKNAQDQGRPFEEALKKAGENLPIKYIATADEFAQLALFLASEKSSYITGTSINVDGGSSKGLF